MAKRFYHRRNQYEVADELEQLARALRQMGWDEIGGKLLRCEETGRVIGRTKWIPRAPWWAERPFWFNEQQCAGVVHKMLRGRSLTQLERRVLAYLIEVAGIDPPKQNSDAPEASWEDSCVA